MNRQRITCWAAPQAQQPKHDACSAHEAATSPSAREAVDFHGSQDRHDVGHRHIDQCRTSDHALERVKGIESSS
ncbi:hypothetical protein [Azospirillum oleiclasticum]|uniref:Uncharacterized protein n=1 Tax=Azospirillum oleiclasticum TaxID=2735135 RepID=A0ABX2T6U0_9PROT|nr:hypothetical protein [Azospirillum oleiclasticum]NYZ20054.1 hypothetical protein [Azospirillum oleiclasticum]